MSSASRNGGSGSPGSATSGLGSGSALESLLADGPLEILDVGGGAGGLAVPLAERGHRVTVVDPSPDALALLVRRAEAAGVGARIRPVQGDGDRLADVVAADTMDMVLCHHVLEFVDDPARTVAALRSCVRVGGWVSLLVANQAAAVLTRALSGRPDAALALLAEPGAGGHRRFDHAELHALLEGAGLPVTSWHGVGVVADLIPEADSGATRELESILAQRSPYRDLAADLHLLCQR